MPPFSSPFSSSRPLPVQRFKRGLLIGALCLSAFHAHAQLPASAQADLLELRMVEAVKAERHQDFLNLLASFRQAGGTAGLEMRLHEGLALQRTGKPLEAAKALEDFIARAGREHPLYTRGLTAYAEVEPHVRKANAVQQGFDVLRQAMQRRPEGLRMELLPQPPSPWQDSVTDNRFTGLSHASELFNFAEPLPDGGWLALGHRPPDGAPDTTGSQPPAALRRFDEQGRVVWTRSYDWSRIAAAQAGGVPLPAGVQSVLDHARRAAGLGVTGMDVSPAVGTRSEVVATPARPGAMPEYLCANIDMGQDPRKQFRMQGVWARMGPDGELLEQRAWLMPPPPPVAYYGDRIPGFRWWYDSALLDCVVLPDGALLTVSRANFAQPLAWNVDNPAGRGLVERRAYTSGNATSRRMFRVFEPDGRLRAEWSAQSSHADTPQGFLPFERRFSRTTDTSGWVWRWQNHTVDASGGALRAAATSATPLIALQPYRKDSPTHDVNVFGKRIAVLGQTERTGLWLWGSAPLPGGQVVALLGMRPDPSLLDMALPDEQPLNADGRTTVGMLVAFEPGRDEPAWALRLLHGRKPAGAVTPGGAWPQPFTSSHFWSDLAVLADGSLLVQNRSGIAARVSGPTIGRVSTP